MMNIPVFSRHILTDLRRIENDILHISYLFFYMLQMQLYQKEFLSVIFYLIPALALMNI